MEEIVKLIPLLLFALLVDTSIILFILVPPVLFGGTFALIEWASQNFNPLSLLDILQIGMYTGTTALISEFVPLFLTGVTLVGLRHRYRPSAIQMGFLGLGFGSAYGLLHYHLVAGHPGDVVGFVAVMSGIGAYAIDRYQKERGSVPMSWQQLFLAPDTSGDLKTITLKSDRLDFQSVDLSLAETIYETFTPEVARFMIPRAPMIPAESEQFLRETLTRVTEGREIVLAIRDAHTGRFLGLCGIHARADAREPELGIWLREDAQGQGYGTEAIGALIQWGSRHLVCDRFRYPVSRHNQASRRVAEANRGVLLHERTVTGDGGNCLDEVVYALPRLTPDPARVEAELNLWITQGAVAVSLHSERYRLERDRNIRLVPKPSILMQAYTITGSHLYIRNRRIEQRPKAWIEAGRQIQHLLDDPDQTLVFFSRDAALALAIHRISTQTPDLLSIEMISDLALDPEEPVFTNRHDPIAPIQTLDSIPDNYYVLIFAINGRYKHIYHYRSNGELVFEEIHTMGKTKGAIRPNTLPAASSSTQEG